MRSDIINIILTEDFLVREGLKSLLAPEKSFRVVGEATTGEGVLNLLKDGTSADVILTDFRLPDMDCIKLNELIKAGSYTAKLVVLSSFASDSQVVRTLQGGVSGFLLKSIDITELIFAIKHIQRENGPYVCTKLMAGFISRVSVVPEQITDKNSISPNFTKREIDILTMVSQGYTNDQIADKMFTSRRTIENYRQNLIDKTGSRNIVSLVRFALVNGLIS